MSSLASIDFRQDEWEVDVTSSDRRKGLMLPPGLGSTRCPTRRSPRAETRSCARNYWDWRPGAEAEPRGFFPYTPATNLLFALREALRMLQEEGLQNVFRRHDRHCDGDSSRGAGMGAGDRLRGSARVLELDDRVLHARRPRRRSFRTIVLEHFDMSLGVGLSKLAGRVVRIGHLGSFNDLMLAGTLSGIEMGLRLAAVPHRDGGVTAALRSLVQEVATEQTIG